MARVAIFCALRYIPLFIGVLWLCEALLEVLCECCAKGIGMGFVHEGDVEILDVMCKDVEKDGKWAIFGLGIHLGIQFRYSLFEV